MQTFIEHLAYCTVSGMAAGIVLGVAVLAVPAILDIFKKSSS